MFNFRWILILDVQTRSGSDNCFKNRIRIQKYFENLIRIRLRLENRIRNRPKHLDPKPWFQQGTDRLHTGYFAENRGKAGQLPDILRNFPTGYQTSGRIFGIYWIRIPGRISDKKNAGHSVHSYVKRPCTTYRVANILCPNIVPCLV